MQPASLALRCSLLLLAAAPLSAQTTWYVDDDGTAPGTGTPGNPFTSIQYAIDFAAVQPGDTISIAAGTYAESLTLDKALSLLGANVANVILDAGGAGRGLLITEDSVVENMTIRNGTALNGGGILVDGASFNAADIVVESCAATLGGGMAVRNGSMLLIDDSTFAGNVADSGGGIHITNSLMELYSCTIDDNWADGNDFVPLAARGGGIYSSDSVVELNWCTVTDNRAYFEAFGVPRCEGGGIWSDEYLALFHCVIDSNRSGDDFDQWVTGDGGGLFATCNSFVFVEFSEFKFNNAGGIPANGGGHRGPGEFRNTLFQGNSASLGGGLASTGCNLVIIECELVDNRNSWEGGGGGGVAGPAEIVDSTLRENWSVVHGGAAVDCDLSNCLVLDNEVFGSPFSGVATEGGGLLDCTAFDCRIEGNKISFQSGYGGGSVFGAGSAGGLSFDCTYVGNIAGPATNESIGGGAYETQLVRCVLVDNEAEYGGGFAGCDASHTTLYRNQASVGGSAVDDSSSANSTLENCIVWGHDFPVLVQGSGTLNVSYTLVENSGWAGPGNIGGDPLFWYPLTGDVHLKPGSPAVDAGTPALADMGPYPLNANYGAAPANYCEGNLNSSGCRAEISSTGSPTLTGPDDFTLEVDQGIAGLFGIFIVSLTPAEVPFQGATLCLAPQIKRSSPVLMGGTNPCGGTGSWAFTQSFMGAPVGVLAFQNAYAQFWYRDIANPPFNIGLSDAIEITIRP